MKQHAGDGFNETTAGMRENTGIAGS